MAAQKTITINGRAYDAATGLPVDSPKKASVPPTTPKAAATVPTRPTVPAPSARKATAPSPVATKPAAPKSSKPAAPAQARAQMQSGTVHGSVQKSQTLMRRAAKKPAAPQKIVRRSQPGRHMDIARNTQVSKFAPHPVVQPKTASASPVKPAAVKADTPARVHPTAKRAIAKAQVRAKKQQLNKTPAPATAKEVKDAAIAKALATPKVQAKKKKNVKRKWLKRSSIIAGIILVVLLALLAVYKFVPSISVSVAAAQAGIQARYPEYLPDGYALKQPVTYGEGEVTLAFQSNSNDAAYTITQKRSSWDSSAVLDNVVAPAVGENYTTTKERGLTIYTYSKGAAWVNAGILYTITGDAPLSGDQIRRIATSL